MSINNLGCVWFVWAMFCSFILRKRFQTNNRIQRFGFLWTFLFSNFSFMFQNPPKKSNLNSNCSNLLDMRNLQEQVKKAFCYQKMFWPFTVWINCSSDLKGFANSRPSALNFKSFPCSLEQFFLTVGQNNFGNKIPNHKGFLTSTDNAYLIHTFFEWNYQSQTTVRS